MFGKILEVCGIVVIISFTALAVVFMYCLAVGLLGML